MLKYLTRGESSPSRKPKVYISYAPPDDARIADIAADLLSFEIGQDCSVWYDDDPSAPDGTDLSLLKEMQMFVVPVTSAFLLTENRARDVEVKLALDEHIPILPLAFESSLIPIFNKRIGDLQLIDVNSQDSTAAGYEEVFSQFLSSVLIGGELSGRIRGAFDAYIFLSYRKKDRMNAQQLMRQIHNAEPLQSVAIWYDEFLIPGENFNRAISDALSACDLFALAVTPNILESGNYVMETEYPMARSLKKPIVAVEMIATPRPQLESIFELSDCVPAENDGGVHSLLMQRLPSAVGKAVNDPEKDYLIGLAYLSGTDVEKNADIALALLTRAAGDKHTGAVSRLVQMYLNGEGVARDIGRAIDWQNVLVDIRRERYLEEKTVSAGVALNWEMEKLSVYRKWAGSFADGKECILACIALCRELLAAGDDVNVRVNLARACFELAGILKSSGDADGAIKMCRETEETLKGLTDDPRAADLLIKERTLASGVCLSRGDSGAAEKYLTDAAALISSAAQRSGEPKREKNLAVIWLMLSEVYRRGDQPDAAEKYAADAAQLGRRLSAQDDSEKSLLILFQALNSLSMICDQKGDLPKANQNAQEGLAICRRLDEKYHNSSTKFQLFGATAQLGDIFLKQKENAEAKRYFTDGLALGEEIAASADTFSAKTAVGDMLQRLCVVSLKCGENAAALEYGERMIDIYEKLGNETKYGADIVRRLSAAYLMIGTAYSSAKQSAKAKALLTKGLETFGRFDPPQMMNADRAKMAAFHLSLGVIGKSDESLTHLKSAYRIYSELSEKFPQVPAYRVNAGKAKGIIDKLYPEDAV